MNGFNFENYSNFIAKCLLLKQLKPELNLEMTLTLFQGSVFYGQIESSQNGYLVLSHPKSDIKNHVSLIRESDIIGLSLSLTDELARFLVPRKERKEHERMGNLELSRKIQELGKKVQADLNMGLELKSTDLTTEDVLIIEEQLPLLMHEILKVKEFDSKVTDGLKTIRLTTGNETLDLSLNDGILSLNLSKESSSLFEAKRSFEDQLNKLLDAC